MSRLGLQGLGLAAGGPAPIWLPTDVSSATMAWWFRADLGLSAGAVTTWPDQSGNGRDITQANASRKPVCYTSGGPNGLAYVWFDGVDDYLRGTWTQSQPEFVFAVAQVSRSGVLGSLMDGATAASRWIYTDGTRITANAGASLTYICNEQLYHRIEALYNGASGRLRIDDNAPSTGNIGSNNSNGLVVGIYGSLAWAACDCNVCELISYTSEPSAGDIASLHTYATARYGV